MGLIATGERVALTPLTGGVSSQIVRASTPRGSLCIKRALPKLKVAADWHAPVERNEAEVAWLKLAGSLIPGRVPQVLGEDGVSRAFAMSYLDAARYAVWKDQLRDGVTLASTARALGEHLAAIHRGTARSAVLAAEFANDASFRTLRLEPYFVAAAQANAECAAALHHLIDTTARTRLALVHGDVSPKNILVGAEGLVILDAECACYGDPAFDLAFCLTHLLLKCVWAPAATEGFLACFDAMKAAYLAGVDWEPRPGLEARAAALLPALMLARIDGKSPVEYITLASQRQRVRGFARAWLLQAPVSLDTIRNAWSKEPA